MTLVAKTMIMMSAKLAHLLCKEKMFSLLKRVKSIDTQGLNHNNDVSEYPTKLVISSLDYIQPSLDYVEASLLES